MLRAGRQRLRRAAHLAPCALRRRRPLRVWGAFRRFEGVTGPGRASTVHCTETQTGGRRGSVAGGGVDIQRHAPHRPHSWLLEPARARRQVPTFPMDLQGPLQTSSRTSRGHTWHLGARARPGAGLGTGCAGTGPQHLSRGAPEPARAAGGPSGDPRWPGTPTACGFQEHSCPHSTPRF